MKKIIWIFLLTMAIGFLAFNASAIGYDWGKRGIEGVYYTQWINDDQGIIDSYLIFLPNSKLLYFSKYHEKSRGLLQFGRYHVDRSADPVNIDTFLDKEINPITLKFRNFMSPPQIEFKTFIFIKQNFDIKDFDLENFFDAIEH